MVKNIFLIEDDETTMLLLRKTILRYSFAENIIELRHGRQALDYLEQIMSGQEELAPDLIMLDLDMPVMDGWQFLDEYTRRYKHHFPHTQICILTTSDDEEEYQRAKQYPIVTYFLKKPCFLSDLDQVKQQVFLKLLNKNTVG
ncbi:response regulator transcription factor [Telluribacter sp. SYSU D00476]|uniref:response regulator transcription factor n=1 Tax=Telluribacter sp. SYSU D00476 TaxID=2811430 RepID=UPI001FF24655|nr:response regulator [Telluribacter sp. SYSU D00476]